jgi:hypothetical protein
LQHQWGLTSLCLSTLYFFVFQGQAKGLPIALAVAYLVFLWVECRWQCSYSMLPLVSLCLSDVVPIHLLTLTP